MGTNRISIILIGLLVMSCASVPKESPELSQEIGQRVAAMQSAHLKLLHNYFDLKREQVIEVFEEE